MREGSGSAVSPYAVPVAALEALSRVDTADQIEERSSGGEGSAWAWDEERRQARLAGGA